MSRHKTLILTTTIRKGNKRDTNKERIIFKKNLVK